MITLKCKNCNAELKPQDKFCSDCGAVVAVQTTPQQQQQSPQPSYSQPKAGEQQSVQAQQPLSYQTAQQKQQPQTSQACQPTQQQPYQMSQPTQQNTYQAPQAQTYQAAQPVTGEQAAAAVTFAETASKLSDGKKSKDNTQLGVFGYVITMLALSVPILGLILVFVWAFGAKTNLARKNFCRGVLIVSGIFLALAVTGFILNYNAWMGFMEVLME
jgi:cation transport ATPase